MPIGAVGSARLPAISTPLTAAPNFAFELAVRRTHDEDMAGLDLGNVLAIISGSERIHAATLGRFTERFARFNLRDSVIRPSYGLAEATVYAATRGPGQPPEIVHFEPDKLSAGHAHRCPNGGGTPLVSYGVPRSPQVRIVDPETKTEGPSGTVGEIWLQGENVALGYWRKPEATGRTLVHGWWHRRPAHPKSLGCEPEIWGSSPRASCSSWGASRIC